MDGCSIVFHEVPKVNDIVKELEYNNAANCYRLGTLLKSDGFLQFCREDSVANTDNLESINKNTLRRLIKDYRNRNFFNVNNTSKVNANSGMYAFRSQAAFDTATQYCADIISNIDYRLSASNNKPKDNYITSLIATTKNALKKQLIAKANQYGSFDINNIEAAYYAIEENGTNQERNFKDLVQSALGDPDFWNDVFCNSKIASLGRNTNFTDEAFKISLMSDNNEDVISDVEQSDEVDLSTKQWDFGSNISNYTEHISNDVRQYFNGLQRLNSTQKHENGAYDIDRSNPLGVPTCHTYQECVIELSNIIGNLGGFKSINDFIDAIEAVANNKKEFASFIKLADDMKAKPDFANKIYTDLNKFTIDKLEISIDGFGTIKSIQSNTSNNPVRKLYFNLRNDLKGSSIQNDNIYIEGLLAELEEKIKKLGDTGKTSKIKLARRSSASQKASEENAIKFDSLVMELKDIYKTYFPSMNDLAIDNYIERHNRDSETHRKDNLYRLLSYAQKVNSAAKKSLAEKESRDLKYREVQAENRRRLNAYRQALAAQVPNAKYIELELPKFDGEYLVGSEEALGNIALAIEPYTLSKAELNSRNTAGNLNSDVIYNNFITNIAKICGDREVLNNWVKEKLRSTEYAYSNILIDNPEQGIVGLFRQKPNGDYELSPYAEKIIAPYLLNGVSNQQSGTNTDYTKMSDGDYYLVGLYAYHKKLQTYKKYNTITANGQEIETAPFLMRIPSDAPKNFAISMPKYHAYDLWQYDTKAMNAYIKDRKKELIKVANIDIANEQLTKLNAQAATVEEVINFVTNTPEVIKTSPGKLLNINAQVGTEQRIAYVINDSKEGWQYHYFSGIFTDDGKGNYYLANAKYDGQAVFSDYVSAYANEVESIAREEFKVNHPEARSINKKHPLFNGFMNIVKGEIFDYYKALYDVQHNDKEHLVEWFHYNPKKGVYDGNKLTGNAFKFTKLDSSVGYNIGEELERLVSSTSSTGEINLSGYSESSNASATISISEGIESELEQIVTKWIDAYQTYFVNETHNKFGSFLEGISDNEIIEYGLNAYIHFANFDDLFEGNSKYYKDPQTFLKRAKESQAGGTSYSITNYKSTQGVDSPFTQSVNEIAGSQLMNGNKVLTFPNGKPVTLRTGWNAITVKNSIRPSSNRNILYDKLIAAGTDKAKAEEIAEGFGYVPAEREGESSATTTTINDAQSYITIYEAARRLKILGEYPKYARLIEQLTDNTTDVNQINPNELQGFIQVMKNFYYDHYYNKRFGRHLPRQIKNAEFVLVPKFLEGTSLGELANFMIENDIDQVNTQETSKAANYDVLTYWDNEGVVTPENLAVFREKAKEVKQPFSYMYLYKQQDVPQHMVDAQNKAGIQVMKKILDNSQAAVASHKNNFIRAYVANIREDFNSLMDKYGIKFDKNYRIIGDNNGKVDYNRIYKLALIEAARLGLDSNTIEYLTVKNEDAGPVMPSYMNIVASKIESIAQSQFNKFITRQKLPGWHGAQITSVGLDGLIKKSKQLKAGETIETDTGERVELAYHKDGSEVEILLPKWAKAMFNQYDENGNLVKEIRIEDIDEEVLKCIGYRIPTEGKQSMAVMKVVGFLPEWMGSTIVVPDEWVTQTGSDFDVDSIYGIAYETYLGKDGRIHKVEFSDSTAEAATYGRYVSHVLRNSDKERITRDMLQVDRDTKQSIKDKYFEVIRKSNKDLEDYLEKRVKELLDEGDTYHELPDEFKPIVDGFLRNKELKFADRVSGLLSIMPTYSRLYGDNPAFIQFYDKYSRIADVIAEQRDMFRRINDNANSLTIDDIKELSRDKFGDIINERAVAFGLPTYEEFKQLPIEDQNNRRARNNRIVDSMIAIMNDKSSLEENLARSNFDDITAANKALDKLDAVGAKQRNVYNLFDQIQFHRNAMGGATLKAFSVARDTGNSVFNVAKAELSIPIRVKYGNRVNLDIAAQAFPVKDGIVYHNRIGNSKNNKNVVGDYITVASSHTTAHILDAIKEGAIKNENEYTFAAFKTLFDIGCDAYTAMAWLRQPGVSRIVEAYYESQSVFVRGNYNPIHTAIKRVAHDLGVKVRNEVVTDNNNITEVMNALQQQYGEEFAKMYPNSTISFDNRDNADVFIIDVPTIEERFAAQNSGVYDEASMLIDLATILNFNYINDYSRIIANHVKVLNPDKFGAKQTIYSTRKVIDDIGTIINSDDANRINVNGEPLLEAIYPGITKATETGVFMPELYLAETDKVSAYPALDAFMRYSTVPSILINKGLFETESHNFVNAINSIQNYISGSVNEKLYNDFKKYVLEYMYKGRSEVISSPIYLDKNGNIEIDIDTINRTLEQGFSPVEDETRRIYGFGYDINYNININNVANPTQEEVNAFAKLTPAQKVHFVQSHLLGSQRTIFSELNVNLFNEFEFRTRGISSQIIRFNDQQQDMESIYKMFDAAFNNTNPIIRLTAIDIIKYAFVVEGYQFRRGNVSKVIKNSALYTSREDGGTGIIDSIRFGISSINDKDLAANNIYEDYIRSHSNIPQVPTYRVRYNKNKASITYLPNSQKMYYFNLGTVKDTELAKEIGIVKDITDKRGATKTVLSTNYINIVNRKVSTLYRVNLYGEGNNKQVYLIPLNNLEENEHGEFSSNPINNKYLSSRYYEDIINLSQEQQAPFSRLAEEKNELFTKEGIEPYRYKKPTVDKEIIVPTDRNFIATIAEQDASVRNFIRSINDKFANQGTKVFWVWNGSQTLRQAFGTKNIGAVQTIMDNDGNLRDYIITRKQVKLNKKISTDEQLEGLTNAKRNGVQSTDNIYTVVPYIKSEAIEVEKDIEDVEHASSIDMDIETTNISKLGNLAQQFVLDLKTRAKVNSDENASIAYQDILNYGVEEQRIASIEERKQDTIKRSAEFYITKAHELERKLNNFIIDEEGTVHDIVSDYTINAITNNEELRNEYISLILQASTFGNSFPLINEIATDNIDDATRRNIKGIQETINNIKNNLKLKQGFEIVAENIFKPLSTNPNFDKGLSDITNYILKDASVLDWLFQDAQELSYPIVQIILREAKAKLDKLKFEGDNYVKNYKKQLASIKSEAAKAGKTINWNNVVNPVTGKFVSNHTDKFTEDKNDLNAKVKETKGNYGEYSREYLRAKHERDLWYLTNTEQKYVSEYYQRVTDNEASMLTDYNIDYYIKYLKLNDERNKLLRIFKGNRTEEDNAAIKRLSSEIREMQETTDFNTGEWKPQDAYNRASNLRKYVDEVSRIKKAFFERKTREGFEEDLKHYLGIINKYKHFDSAGRQIENEDVLLQVDEYANAVEWLNENTYYRINEKLQAEINEAFAALNGNKEEKNSQFKSIVQHTENAYDNYGVIDGRQFNEKQVKAIKEEQEAQYANRANDGESAEVKLLRNKAPISQIYSKKFYAGFSSTTTPSTVVTKTRNTIVKEINAILKDALNPNTGKIKLSDLTIEQIRELSELYDRLDEVKRLHRKDEKVKKFLKEEVSFHTDKVTYDLDEDAAKQKGKEFFTAWRTVANAKNYDENGIFIGYTNEPNSDIFGYVTPKLDDNGNVINKDYVDEKRSKALEFLNKNIEFVPTSYYWQEREQAIRDGKLKEFEDKNHIFNPLSGKMEPIRIWTTIRVKDETSNTRNYVASYNNTRSKPLPETVNANYNRYTDNYNGSAKYYVNDNSNEYEKKIRKLMQDTLYDLTKENNTAMSFVSKGLFPRRRRTESTLPNTVKAAFNAIGFGQSLDPDRHISDNIGYEYDRETNIPLLASLKDKTYKRIEDIPKQGLTESDEDYKTRVDDIKKRNEEAIEYNRQLDVKLMDKDYESVFEEFIKGAIQANAKTQTKLDLYYLLEYMRTQAQSYRLTGFNNLAVDRRNSTEDRKVYKTQAPKRVIDLIETWSKRFLFDEYKGKNTWDKFAAVGQNIASAKYMMFNITGGIGNILTGSTNIFMERYAGEYFNHKDWENAKFGYYIKAVPYFLANMNKDISDNLTDAIIKLMGVVDYNGIRETSKSIDSIEIINKMRNFAYSPQSAGEHFMQNTAMIAMMISNRVYKNQKGEIVIGDFHNYNRMLEDVALRKVIEGNTELEELYAKFVNRIKEDKNRLKDYLWFKKDVNTEFLRSLSDKTYGLRYAEVRNELTKEAKKEFDTLPKLIDQFELKDGYAKLKDDSLVDLGKLAAFKGKVVSVNKKIHGVYDRLGGARIESSWVFGSLLMQYHKHIYTGALKHFRNNGYYNESRESIERGFYVSLWDFATTEFKGIGDRAKAKANDDGTNIFIAGVQQVCRAFIDTFLNYKFNYATMSNAERANVRRALGELTGIAYGLLGGIAASCALLAADDDDETAKIIANLALYQADRLSSETIMYNIGAVSEFDKLWSSPVALGQSFKDVMSAFGFVAKYITEGDEFNPNYTTGLYKGENKLAVYVKRQIPIYRGINRIVQLDQNNKYYKLTENMLGIIPTQSIAEWVVNGK
jgi:hypothetical protein